MDLRERWCVRCSMRLYMGLSKTSRSCIVMYSNWSVLRLLVNLLSCSLARSLEVCFENFELLKTMVWNSSPSMAVTKASYMDISMIG